MYIDQHLSSSEVRSLNSSISITCQPCETASERNPPHSIRPNPTRFHSPSPKYVRTGVERRRNIDSSSHATEEIQRRRPAALSATTLRTDQMEREVAVIPAPQRSMRGRTVDLPSCSPPRTRSNTRPRFNECNAFMSTKRIDAASPNISSNNKKWYTSPPPPPKLRNPAARSNQMKFVSPYSSDATISTCDSTVISTSSLSTMHHSLPNCTTQVAQAVRKYPSRQRTKSLTTSKECPVAYPPPPRRRKSFTSIKPSPPPQRDDEIRALSARVASFKIDTPLRRHDGSAPQELAKSQLYPPPPRGQRPTRARGDTLTLGKTYSEVQNSETKSKQNNQGSSFLYRGNCEDSTTQLPEKSNASATALAAAHLGKPQVFTVKTGEPLRTNPLRVAWSLASPSFEPHPSQHSRPYRGQQPARARAREDTPVVARDFSEAHNSKNKPQRNKQGNSFYGGNRGGSSTALSSEKLNGPATATVTGSKPRFVSVKTGEPLNVILTAMSHPTPSSKSQASGPTENTEEPYFCGFRQDYALGDTVRSPSDMITELTPQKAIAAVDLLSNHDHAFVKRSDGLFSYAIMAFRFYANQDDNCSSNRKAEECMTFVMNKLGQTKVIERSQWGEMIKLVSKDNPHKDRDDPKGSATSSSTIMQRDVESDFLNYDPSLDALHDMDDNQKRLRAELYIAKGLWLPSMQIAFGHEEEEDLVSELSNVSCKKVTKHVPSQPTILE